jgi:hypothetical protein
MPQLNFQTFKSNDINSDIGPRTAAVLTFSDDINNSVVKELTQNSLDARRTKGGELIIKIKLVDIDINAIPNFSSFLEIFKQMKDYWNNKSPQYSTFFKTAEKSISTKKIKTFVFEDFETNGLNGNDKEGTFQSCVNSDNVSTKDSQDSLGNHGIGKNSVFGLTPIQTVFYSSLNSIGEFKFKGISKLGTYVDVAGIKKAEKIYYGDCVSESEVLLINDNNYIPEVFRRTSAGLSQFVLGVDIGDEWKENIKKAFISNYWFLFENKKLKVVIGDFELSFENYREEAEKLFNESDTIKDTNPLPYIKAYKTSLICKEKNIFKIGNVKLYLLEAEDDEVFPNRVVFLRDGMRIKSDALGVGGLPTKIAGVMFCEDQIGNSILGAMEPHAHDKFSPELVKSKKLTFDLSVDEARKILKEIDDFRKEIIREIKEKYTTGTETVSAVDELFKSIINGLNANGANSISDNESYKRMISKIEFVCNFDSSNKSLLIDKTKKVDINQGVGDGPGSGKGKGGKGIHGGGKNSQGQKGGAGDSKQKTKTSVANNIKSRFYKIETESDNDINTYTMVLRSDTSVDNFEIVITQHGDSNRTQGQMSSRLINIIDRFGQQVDFSEVKNKEDDLVGYRLKNLSIINNAPSIYKLKLEEKMNSALKININL